MAEGTTTAPDLRQQMEDHALTSVPESERRSGWGLMTNTAGIASTLIQLAIGGTVTLMAGVWMGILAGVIVAVFGGVMGWLVGHVAYKSGTSSTVTARFYGLGTKGSAVASLIFAFMILGFLALENALLYYGTLFMFGMAPTLLNAIVIYGVLTVVWILMTLFGLKLVQRTSMVLLIAFTVLTIYLAVVALQSSGLGLGELFSAGPVVPDLGSSANRFAIVISMLAGSAGALALVDADFARYAKSTKDVGILAVGGAIMIDIIVVVLGTILIHAGSGAVASFLDANPEAAASQQGGTTAEKLAWMIANNAGAFFVVLSGLLGFILMYVAQAKAQVLNTYSGSLALANLTDGLFGWRPGRVVMVVVGNVIGLLMVAGNILGFIAGYLGILGVTTTALAAVIIADYFIVRKRKVASVHEVEAVNWAGLISVILGSVIGGVLQQTGVTPLGFVVSLVLVLVGYPLLRAVIKPSQAISADDAARALRED